MVLGWVHVLMVQWLGGPGRVIDAARLGSAERHVEHAVAGASVKAVPWN